MPHSMTWGSGLHVSCRMNSSTRARTWHTDLDTLDHASREDLVQAATIHGHRSCITLRAPGNNCHASLCLSGPPSSPPVPAAGNADFGGVRAGRLSPAEKSARGPSMWSCPFSIRTCSSLLTCDRSGKRSSRSLRSTRGPTPPPPRWPIHWRLGRQDVSGASAVGAPRAIAIRGLATPRLASHCCHKALGVQEGGRPSPSETAGVASARSEGVPAPPRQPPRRSS